MLTMDKPGCLLLLFLVVAGAWSVPFLGWKKSNTRKVEAAKTNPATSSNVETSSSTCPSLKTANEAESGGRGKRNKQSMFCATGNNKAERKIDEDDGNTKAKERLQEFLDATYYKTSDDKKPNFHFSAWHWHNLSLVREFKRLQDAARRLSAMDDVSTEDLEDFRTATDYVVNFNMRGLHTYERETWFPWLRHKIPSATAEDDPDLATAFSALMDELEKKQQSIEQLATKLVRTVMLMPVWTSIYPRLRLSRIWFSWKLQNSEVSKVTSTSKLINFHEVDMLSGKVMAQARSAMEEKEAFLIPFVAQLVPDREQKSMVSKIINSIGLSNLRLHLAAFHEAVLELKSKEETELFRKKIDPVSRLMIPRWTRLLYAPRTRILAVE